MTKTGELLLFAISFLFVISAGAVTVQASVDSNETSIEQAITLTVSVLSNESVDIESPRLTDMDGFRLDNTWDSTSVSQKMVSTPSGMDWETQRRKDFNFALAPMKAGRLSIPALDVKVSGKIYRTQPIMWWSQIQGLTLAPALERSPVAGPRHHEIIYLLGLVGQVLIPWKISIV